MMKRSVVCIGLCAAILSSSALLASCKYKGGAGDAESTDAVTTKNTEITYDIPDDIISPETEPPETEPPLPEYYKITQNGNKYGYILYAPDGSLAAEETGFYERPAVTEIGDKLFRIAAEGSTIYFDYNKNKISDSYFGVLDEHGSLLLREEGATLVVSDIFGDADYLVVIDSFAYPLYTDEGSPFVECGFEEDGSVNVVYLSRDPWSDAVPEERSECINLSNDTRCVIVHNWDSVVLPVEDYEREEVENYLSWNVGSWDYNTGYSITYRVTGRVEINGTLFYHCLSYYVTPEEETGEALVKCAEFVISENKWERYDCSMKDGHMKVYTENNMA